MSKRSRLETSTDVTNTYASSTTRTTSSATWVEAGDIKVSTVTHTEVVEEKKNEESSSLSTSRYAREGVTSMFDGLSNDMCLQIQDAAYKRLLAAKVLVNPGDLTQNIVTSNPCLNRFVCWSASGSGIRLHKSGGKFNESLSLQVGVPNQTDKQSRIVNCKNIKLQGAKTSLVRKIGILYKDLEGRGEETSHLCHSTRGCWRPDHLCAESHKDNVARNSQFGCAGWFWFMDTQALVCYCAHTPRCEFVRIVPQQRGFGDNAPIVVSDE